QRKNIQVKQFFIHSEISIGEEKQTTLINTIDLDEANNFYVKNGFCNVTAPYDTCSTTDNSTQKPDEFTLEEVHEQDITYYWKGVKKKLSTFEDETGVSKRMISILL